mmetsp:Transcript_5084/g.12740  ORF Transcript_5084/g.12740 Transcript_5084/m.12740 type:complete len:301 (+) Transcript_5084:5364-6266(+)
MNGSSGFRSTAPTARRNVANSTSMSEWKPASPGSGTDRNRTASTESARSTLDEGGAGSASKAVRASCMASAARASPRVSMSATFDRASLMPPSRAFIVRPLPPDFKDALSSVIARTMHRDRSGSRMASSTRGALTCKRRPTTPDDCCCTVASSDATSTESDLPSDATTPRTSLISSGAIPKEHFDSVIAASRGASFARSTLISNRNGDNTMSRSPTRAVAPIKATSQRWPLAAAPPSTLTLPVSITSKPASRSHRIGTSMVGAPTSTVIINVRFDGSQAKVEASPDLCKTPSAALATMER